MLNEVLDKRFQLFFVVAGTIPGPALWSDLRRSCTRKVAGGNEVPRLIYGLAHIVQNVIVVQVGVHVYKVKASLRVLTDKFILCSDQAGELVDRIQNPPTLGTTFGNSFSVFVLQNAADVF